MRSNIFSTSTKRNFVHMRIKFWSLPLKPNNSHSGIFHFHFGKITFQWVKRTTKRVLLVCLVWLHVATFQNRLWEVRFDFGQFFCCLIVYFQNQFLLLKLILGEMKIFYFMLKSLLQKLPNNICLGLFWQKIIFLIKKINFSYIWIIF